MKNIVLSSDWQEHVSICTGIVKPFLNLYKQWLNPIPWFQLSSVQSLSHVWLCDPMDCSPLDFPVHHQLPELAQTHVHRVRDAIQPSHPLPFHSPPTFELSQHQGLFQWVSSSHLVAKVLEFQLQHQFFNEYSALIFFRMDWLDLLAVQGTLNSLLQHHSPKASIFWCSAFFIVSPTLTFVHD